MKKINIGIFMDDFFPSVNGVIMVIDNYARKLSKYANVTVVVPYTGKVEKEEYPYQVIRIRSQKIYSTAYHCAMPVWGPSINKTLKDCHFDLIHVHSPAIMGIKALQFGKRNNIPVIATMHTQFYLEFKKVLKSKHLAKTMVKIMMKMFNGCYKCYAVSESVADLFVTYGAKTRPGVLNNGTELTLVKDPKKARNTVNKMFNLKNSELVFLFLGRVDFYKNILFIIEALKNLKEQRVKFKMLFVGPLEDEHYFRKKITELKLDKEVILAGKITDRELISQIYYRADLFLFPSLYDASSLVQIEAASQKTPTVFIEGSTTACYVKDNINGYLAPNDPLLYAFRIKEILKDKKTYKKVCEGAYRDLYRTWDDLVEETYQIYLDTISDYQHKNPCKN